MNKDYEEKFRDIWMNYVKVRVDGEGQVQIENEEDIERLIRRIDEKRNDKKSKPKFEKDGRDTGFVQKLLQTDAARRVLGTTVGRFKRPTTQQSEADQKIVVQYRSQGKQLYRSNDGRLVEKQTIIRYRDVRTNRLVSKKGRTFTKV